MNKKNLPIFMSVLITALFFTMIFYFVYTNVQDHYKGYRLISFADAELDVKLFSNEIKQLEMIKEIQTAGGLSEELWSARFQEAMLAIHFQDAGINTMREYSNLIEGRFAEHKREIVISQNLAEKYQLEVGDKILLQVGSRYTGEQVLSPTATYTDKESFKEQENREYTVVGIHGNVYNKYLDISFALTMPEENRKLSPYIRFKDFKAAYQNREQIKEEIEKQLGRRVDLNFSEIMMHYYGVKESGMKAWISTIINIISILFVIFLFVFFVRNIFRVWGLRKAGELSMYKSIGTTNSQIYWLLMKEAVLISLLPILIGHGLGYLLMSGIYYQMQKTMAVDKIVFMEFSLALSAVTLGVALFIIMLAVFAPAGAIAKINIIDGIRGNFYAKSRKRKRYKDLWKELRNNNMASIKSLRYITAVGTIIISCFLIAVGISDYFSEMSFLESDYNINITYKTGQQEVPPVLKEISRHFSEKKAYISRSKYFNMDFEWPLAEEAMASGIDKQLEEYFEGEEKKIEGMLIGIEEEQLNQLGGKKGEFLLRNLVQEDIKLPLAKAKYIRYLDSPSELSIYLSGAEPATKIKITKEITGIGELEEVIRPLEIQIFTDLDTQKELIEGHNKAQSARSVFELKMKVEDSEITDTKDYLEKTLKAGAAFDEQFNLVSGDEIAAKRSIDVRVLLLIIGGIGLVILLLNITNGYACINLSLLSRKREIGSLYSCGMEKEGLIRLYLTEFGAEEIRSIGITALITAAVMLTIDLLSSSISIKVLLLYFPWLFFGVFAVLIYGVNLLIYYFALRNILKQPVVELIRQE